MDDAFRVRQIVRNLLVNAAKYGEAPYMVAVTSNDDHVCLRVNDHDDGVPDSEAEAIFRRYYRAHDPAGQPGSVGVGLSLSRQLAELMNGTVTYLGDGDSTVFELLLPELRPSWWDESRSHSW